MQHAIFDFDGTLFDSMPTWGGAWLQLAERYHLTTDDDLIVSITPLGIKKSAEYLVHHYHMAQSAQAVFDEVCQIMIPLYATVVQPKAGAAAYLEKLRQEGVRLHILSASMNAFTIPCLKRCGFFDWFDHVWDCAELGYTKSDPAIYDKVAALIGCDKRDMIMYDDNEIALRAAREAGVLTIGVYDAAWEGHDEAVKAVADRYIRSFSELLQ